jgi:Integrase zinc binding domain
MVGVEDEELLNPRTFPREGPIVEVPEAREAPTIDEVRAAQTRDTWCQDLLIGMECGAPSTRFAALLWDNNGILSCKSAINEELPPRWAAPAEIRENILTLGHYSNMAAHPGAQRMYQTLSRKWYWPSMSSYCTAFVQELTLDSGTGRRAGQDNPSRTGQARQGETSRTGRDEQDRIGRSGQEG